MLSIAQLSLEENKITCKKYTMYKFFGTTLKITSQKGFKELSSFILLVLKFLQCSETRKIETFLIMLLFKNVDKQMSHYKSIIKRWFILINIDFEHEDRGCPANRHAGPLPLPSKSNQNFLRCSEWSKKDGLPSRTQSALNALNFPTHASEDYRRKNSLNPKGRGIPETNILLEKVLKKKK